MDVNDRTPIGSEPVRSASADPTKASQSSERPDETVTVRRASASDAVALAALVGELGYPAEPDAMPTRLAALQRSGHVVALVAEADGRVIGLVTAHVMTTIHSPSPVALLTALVVAASARGLGAGRQLVAAVEQWARGHGVVRIAVTSGAQRTDAHQFYERIGYARTGVRFGKLL